MGIIDIITIMEMKDVAEEAMIVETRKMENVAEHISTNRFKKTAIVSKPPRSPPPRRTGIDRGTRTKVFYLKNADTPPCQGRGRGWDCKHQGHYLSHTKKDAKGSFFRY